MNKLHVGLAISVAIGLAIAFFPFYADKVAPHLWSYSGTTRGEEYGGEGLEKVEGIVESVDATEGALVVDGKRITVRGEWTVETNSGTTTMEWSELLSSIVKPGDRVAIECTRTGKWSLMAEEIQGPSYEAKRSEG